MQQKEYLPTIGLEIHAELKTKSKMFCGCENNPHPDSPNRYVCPVCMAHPGTLPVLNKEAIRLVLRVGKAVGGTCADFTEFDRKNYFYPDIPKNYQISQYKYPLILGGSIQGISITRIHLEEDTARSAHSTDTSVVDFNRAGVPLMELVTEPVLHDAKSAVSFARDLRLLLKYLGAGDANLEKGEMRIEVNISLAPKGEKFGTKVEVKNINSFRSVEQAISYEIKRQTEMLEKGVAIAQETRGWDEAKQKTVSQRIKENSHDYRYFPDPDIPKLYIQELQEALQLQETIPELPWQLRERYAKEGIPNSVLETLVNDVELQALFEACGAYTENEAQKQLVTHYLTSDVLGCISKKEYRGASIKEIQPKRFVALLQLVETGKLSSRGAKDVLVAWLTRGAQEDPEKLAEEMHKMQVSDEKILLPTLEEVLQKNKDSVEAYKAGKQNALQFLLGQCMKETQGSANPVVLGVLLERILRELP